MNLYIKHENNRPWKSTLKREAQRVECPLNIVVFMLANSKTFLIHPNAVKLTISLKGLLKLSKSCVFPFRIICDLYF